MEHLIRFTPLAGVFLLAVTGAVFSQPSSPVLLPQLSTDHESYVDAVDDHVKRGYVPIGLEGAGEDTLVLLLTSEGGYAAADWSIHEHTDWNSLQTAITETIEDGMVPMDLSRHGESLSVLRLDIERPIEGWRIHAGENTDSNRRETVARYEDRGFTLTGLSEHSGLLWFLFVRCADDRGGRSAILSLEYSPETIAESLELLHLQTQDPNGNRRSR